MVSRKKWKNAELIEAWEAAGGTPTTPAKCWRCGLPITSPSGKRALYGPHWHMGHAGKAHWLGGSEYAPEHVSCNMKDAVVQTKAAAKSRRIRAEAYGIKKVKRIVPGSRASGWKKPLHGPARRRGEGD
jgi:hypothetical protein